MRRAPAAARLNAEAGMSGPPAKVTSVRWSVNAVLELFEQALTELVFRAQQVHRKHFDCRALQLSTLLSIKTGGCPEDCAYCPQSRRYPTGVSDQAPLDEFEFVRTIAAARITMPRAMVRLSAGRETMSDALQALCFLAGANSIFYGEKLLTTGNPQTAKDRALFERLGITVSGFAT